MNELTLHMREATIAEHSTIVYCATVRDAEDVSSYIYVCIYTYIYIALTKNCYFTYYNFFQVHKVLIAEGINTALYHGKMDSKDRVENHV